MSCKTTAGCPWNTLDTYDLVPPELGNLGRLTLLRLDDNNLAGPIPPSLGDLRQLDLMWLNTNELTGGIPPELGGLSSLEELALDGNDLTGPMPPELGQMSSLHRLSVSNNAGLSGPLPATLASLHRLETLMAFGTDLCAPPDTDFQAWLQAVRNRRLADCLRGDTPPAAYLTQAVQSREYPVPLVAGERALLRVFPIADLENTADIPAVRARFYMDDQEIHVEEIPGKSGPIPTGVDESSLDNSANAEIPADVVREGLEMLIEVDPGGELEPELGVARRIPEVGRIAVEVREMPRFDLTVIPFLLRTAPDHAVVGMAEAMAADPEGHELLWDTRTLLPVGVLAVTAHAPVLTSSNTARALSSETEAIRVIEGTAGHFLGMMPRTSISGSTIGHANGSRASFSIPNSETIAHEFGHNMNLAHAPCGSAGGPDPSFPSGAGQIGVWGYDFRDGGKLVRPSTKDLMSYCEPTWISDYHFSNALRYRVFDEGKAATVATAETGSLLLWGGAGADSVPFLEPAFVVDAPAALPDSVGAYRVTGRSSDGTELFSLSFTMPQTTDGDGSAGFAFVLPVQPGWERDLASITLSGPGGSATLDGGSDSPLSILRDPGSGQVRGILRVGPVPVQVAMDAVGQTARRPLEVLFSRGLPDAAAWRR